MNHQPTHPQSLTIQSHFADDRRVIQLDGPLSIDHADAVQGVLETLTESGVGQEIVIDLSGVTYLGAAGLGLILMAHRRLLRRGGSLSLAAPTPRVWQVIRMTRVDGVIPVWASVADALAHGAPALACAC